MLAKSDLPYDSLERCAANNGTVCVSTGLETKFYYYDQYTACLLSDEHGVSCSVMFIGEVDPTETITWSYYDTERIAT